jgi:hypothetical protein
MAVVDNNKLLPNGQSNPSTAAHVAWYRPFYAGSDSRWVAYPMIPTTSPRKPGSTRRCVRRPIPHPSE